jgi:hypothetical protein
MLRWLLVGLLLMGLGISIQREWIWVDVEKMSTDLNLPYLQDPQRIKRLRFVGGGR